MRALEAGENNNKLELFLKLAILIWPFLFIWQGIDLTDTGYLLTGGQQIFIEPQNVQFSYLLSFLINGVWGRITRPLGLMGAYLGSAFLYVLTASCVYRGFRKMISPRVLLPGLLLAIMVPNILRYINYNNLTAFFFVVGSVILIKAFIERKVLLYLLAGLIFGSSFYLRLPNLVSLSLLLAILAGPFLGDSSWEETFKGILGFISGFLVALFLPFLLLHLNGLSEQYFETFGRLWSIMGDPSSHHSGEGLLLKILADLDKTFAAFFQGFLILLILGKFTDRFNRKIVRSGIMAFCAFTIFLVGFGFIGKTVIYHYYVLAFIGFVLVLQIAGFPPSTREIRFASLVALMVMGFGMAGSNTGLSAARYDLWLALPLSLHGLFNMEGLYLCGPSKLKNRREDKSNCMTFFSDASVKLAGKIIVLSMLLFFMILCYRFSHKDSDRRYLLRHRVDHPKMEYVFTTAERAEVVSEALEELSKYVRPDDYLLAYNYIPLFYYLTDTRPYVYNSWPELYSPDLMVSKLKEALLKRPGLPPVIRAKYPPLNDQWPEKHLSSRGSSRHHQIFDQFLQQFKYVSVWENEFFQILLPPASW